MRLIYGMLILLFLFGNAHAKVDENYVNEDWTTQYLTDHLTRLNDKTFRESGVRFFTLNPNNISFTWEFVGDTDILIKLSWPADQSEKIGNSMESFCRMKVDDFPEQEGKIRFGWFEDHNVAVFKGFRDEMIPMMLTGRSVSMTLVLPPKYVKTTEVFSLKGFKAAFMKAEELYAIHKSNDAGKADALLSPAKSRNAYGSWNMTKGSFDKNVRAVEISSKLPSGMAMVVGLTDTHSSYVKYVFDIPEERKASLQGMDPIRILATISIDSHLTMNVEGKLQYRYDSLYFLIEKGLDPYFLKRMREGKSLTITMKAPDIPTKTFMGTDTFDLSGFREAFIDADRYLQSSEGR
ncbi:MAG: hypothetical protein MJ061_05300 [Mailhella sp.]|nr:hypothetical protein [Mailhella sp.]